MNERGMQAVSRKVEKDCYPPSPRGRYYPILGLLVRSHMSAAVLVQLISACIGIIGSLFFAIGIMRQTVETMARLSGTYWDLNPHMPPALAAQKADYLFGGSLIFIAFLLQLGSFFAPTTALLSESSTKNAPWVAGVVTIFMFFLLRFAAARTAKYYEKQIIEWLSKKRSESANT